MDREQEEMQFLGFFGMVKESIKIIFTWRKIFCQITLCLVLPLAFVFLAHIHVSDFLYYRIHRDERMLDRASTNSTTHDRLSELITTEKIEYWLLMVVYYVFILALNLLSTSAVVYTIACIYTAKSLTFHRVLTVVPKVWKRLMVTFTWSFLVVFVYNLVAFAVFYLMVSTIESVAILISCLIIFLAIYLSGFVYVSVIWHLASVISVLEEHYGFRAMIKSKMLVKGKLVPAVVIFLFLALSYFAVQILFKIFVVYAFDLSVWIRILVGTLCLLCLLKLFLFGLVIETIIYFVCKSYHHENIDKLSLADHLEVYLLAESELRIDVSPPAGMNVDETSADSLTSLSHGWDLRNTNTLVHTDFRSLIRLPNTNGAAATVKM